MPNDQLAPDRAWHGLCALASCSVLDAVETAQGQNARGHSLCPLEYARRIRLQVWWPPDVAVLAAKVNQALNNDLIGS
jgi:hypothetical protein